MQPRLKKENYVIGPDGSPLTLGDLPNPSTQRWVVRRKAEVVAAVRGGLLTLEQACQRYSLTVESSSVGNARSTGMAWPDFARREFNNTASSPY
jgi:hypothetical protein